MTERATVRTFEVEAILEMQCTALDGNPAVDRSRIGYIPNWKGDAKSQEKIVGGRKE
jgi:hypothetical protein